MEDRFSFPPWSIIFNSAWCYPFGQWRLKFNRLEGFIKCRIDSRLHQTTSGVHCTRFTFALQPKVPDVAPAINRNGELCDTDTCEGHGSSPRRVWPVVTCLIPAPQVISPVDVTSKGSVNKRFSIHYRQFYIFVTKHVHHIQLRRNGRQYIALDRCFWVSYSE
jgi:hypothetical protein